MIPYVFLRFEGVDDALKGAVKGFKPVLGLYGVFLFFHIVL